MFQITFILSFNFFFQKTKKEHFSRKKNRENFKTIIKIFDIFGFFIFYFSYSEGKGGSSGHDPFLTLNISKTTYKIKNPKTAQF